MAWAWVCACACGNRKFGLLDAVRLLKPSRDGDFLKSSFALFWLMVHINDKQK